MPGIRRKKNKVIGVLDNIKKCNPDLKVIDVHDKEFATYGRVISGLDCKEVLQTLEETKIPAKGNVYVPSDPKLEGLAIAKTFKNEYFGGLPIQIGYCNGNSYQLNALEYHNCSELNIATTDIVLFLGKASKIQENMYDTKDCIAVYVPKETLIELYGMTMHFAPCKTEETGFKTMVVLLKGTNTDFTEKEQLLVQSKTLFKVNKWLLVHPENSVLISRGGYPGLSGKNLQIQGIK